MLTRRSLFGLLAAAAGAALGRSSSRPTPGDWSTEAVTARDPLGLGPCAFDVVEEPLCATVHITDPEFARHLAAKRERVGREFAQELARRIDEGLLEGLEAEILNGRPSRRETPVGIGGVSC